MLNINRVSSYAWNCPLEFLHISENCAKILHKNNASLINCDAVMKIVNFLSRLTQKQET